MDFCKVDYSNEISNSKQTKNFFSISNYIVIYKHK